MYYIYVIFFLYLPQEIFTDNITIYLDYSNMAAFLQNLTTSSLEIMSTEANSHWKPYVFY